MKGFLSALSLRSLEDPNTPLTGANLSAAEFVELMGGDGLSQGKIVVNTRTALRLSAVYACVRVLAETLATAPMVLYRRTKDGGKERATDHPLFSLLHDEPNPEMDSFRFRETLQGHLGTHGNAYAEIEIDGAGRPVALWPLLPDRTHPQRMNGELWYVTQAPEVSGRPARLVALPADRVLHIAGLGFDGLVGYSPVSMARRTIELGLSTEEYGRRFFTQGAHVGLYASHPQTLKGDTVEKLKEKLEAAYSGLSKSHRIAVLQEGMKLERLGLPQDDSQYLETRQLGVEDVCRFFRMPLHKVGHLLHATFSNIEHQAIEFHTDTMLPWFTRWAAACSRSLLLKAERSEYFVDFVLEGLLRGDLQARYTAYKMGREGGWLSVNDVRRLENLDPLPGAQGDVYIQPLNFVAVGAKPPEPKNSPPAGLARWLEHTLGRITRREVRSLRRLGAGALDAAAFAPTYEDLEEALRRDLEAIEEAFPEALLHGWGADAARRFVAASRGQLAELGDAPALEVRLGSWLETKAGVLTRLELSRLAGEG